MKASNFAKSFHTYTDFAYVGSGPRVIETKGRSHKVIQERDLTFRLYPHFHPYADDLMGRLVTTSMKRMLDADTEYVPSGATLPNSVEVAPAAGTVSRVSSGSAGVLVSKVAGVTAGGDAIEISAGLQLKLVAELASTIVDSVTLVNAWPSSPAVGEPLTLAADTAAVVRREFEVDLPAGTVVRLHDDSTATLSAAGKLLLKNGTRLTLPAGAQVTPLKFKRRPEWYDDAGFKSRYAPGAILKEPYPVNELDFSASGAYACYNRELFIEVPLILGIHLSRNHCFDAAQRCFHLLFDPTDNSDGPTPQRFWKVGPFQTADVQKIEEILVNLTTGADPELRDATIRSIEAWKDAPFRPHVIARYRQQAYMYKIVMAYLDNLISWGDELFRNDTSESVGEATMLYVLAAQILGPKPQPVPAKGTMKRQSYASLRRDLDAFGNTLRGVEAAIPFDLMPLPVDNGGANADRFVTVSSIGKALYFCVPRNDKLLGYWDTVADRLFKIRNSLNAQGVFRQLPLYAPPIDPGALARATAAGVDVRAVVNGLNQPLPLVRFQFLVQKAAEICQEVKSLGQNLLSAMEKEDGEAMTILRTRHERAVSEMVELVKYAQLQEAGKAREGVQASMDLAVQRFTYYQRQGGRTLEQVQNAIPEQTNIDADSLKNMRLAATEPSVSPLDMAFDIAQDLGASGGKILSSHEVEELEKSGLARDIQDVIRFGKLAAKAIRMLPDFGVKFHFWGLGGDMQIGGTTLGEVASYAAEVSSAIGDRLSYEGMSAGRIANFSRREQDWSYQSNLAAGEINQVFKQLRAAELREAIADRELANHREQKKHSVEMQQFLNEEGNEKNGKVTNKSLYTWMKREIKGLYAQAFQLAFDVAKKAERALQHELASEAQFIQYGYLTGREGLLAGEKLLLDVKRMELAYHDLNRRELELTRHVSLLQLDPEALLQLRSTGRCTLRVPETLYDMDGPGQYFRRIKSVAVTIPCVTGAYAGVSCKLTLLKSSIRTATGVGDGYARTGSEDARFSDYFGSTQSIVTSSAQNDSGMFETNLRDERYLPFENAGAISEWSLELPANPAKGDPCQFDYQTISDVILHVRYTARDGGGLLRKESVAALRKAIDDASAPGSVRLFSARHDFPTEWAKFKRQAADGDGRFPLSLTLRPEHYPFWSEGRRKKAKQVVLSARTPAASLTVFDAANAARSVDLAKDTVSGLLTGKLGAVVPIENSAPTGEFKLVLGAQNLDDLWIAIQWGGE